MKRKLIVCIFVFCCVRVHGMMNKLNLRHVRSHRDRWGRQIKIDKKRPGIFCKDFPQEIDTKIIDSVATNSCGIDLVGTCKGFNSLARVNKFLNRYMNDKDRTLTWIKKISEQFGISNECVASQMGTKRAGKCLAMQVGLISYRGSIMYERIEKSVKAIVPFVDINFTYDTAKLTPLMLYSQSFCDVSNHMVQLLIKKVRILLCKQQMEVMF